MCDPELGFERLSRLRDGRGLSLASQEVPSDSLLLLVYSLTMLRHICPSMIHPPELGPHNGLSDRQHIWPSCRANNKFIENHL